MNEALQRAVDELTLRDHFACAALPAALAVEASAQGSMNTHQLAKAVYDIAEAMLHERAARAAED